MRICIVSCEYPPFHGGGIGTYAANISRYLAEAGHEVHVVANRWADYEKPDHGSFEPLERRGNLWIHRVDALRADYGPRPTFAHPLDPLGQICRIWDCSLFWSIHVAEQVERLCREHQIEVVEYPECFAEGYLAFRRRVLGLGTGHVPMTVTLHSPIFEVTEYNLYRKYKGWFQRRNMMEDFCIRQADRLSCPSAHLAGIITRRLELDPREQPIDVIHNPMDFDSLGDLTHLPPEDTNYKFLLFVGRIEPRKGVKEFIDAAVELLPRHPGLHVKLIGRDCDAGEVAGSMTSYLWGRVPPELHQRIGFEGLVPRAEIFARYSAATACVFAPRWDNFPNTCAEAMACGGCVVGADYSGMSEMIEHEQSGLLFQAGNHAALVEALERAVTDSELRVKLRQNAPGRIREVCDPATSVRRRIAHYERTIEDYHRRHAARHQAHPGSPPASRTIRVSLLIPNHTGSEAQRYSLRSVRKAAERAGVELDACLIGTRVHHVTPPGIDDVYYHNTSAWEDNSALAHWAERMAETRPDYAFTLWPGETVDLEFFVRTLAVLEARPRVAWATTWAKSISEKHPYPFAGFDFSLPLEMLYYHQVPFAVIRHAALVEVGGWNCELPNGWRQWDLWLALAGAGWEGLVVPEWHAHFLPEAGNDLRPPEHDKAHELVLEAVIRRNRALFAAHGPELWLNQVTNPVYQFPPYPKVKNWLRKAVKDAAARGKRYLRRR